MTTKITATNETKPALRQGEHFRRLSLSQVLGHERTWLLLLLGLGLAARLFLILLPLRVMLAKTLPDDAFYYFVIARNAAQGSGFTFDKVVPTNGFHPLWALLLIPVFGVFKDSSIAVRAALALGALLDVAAAGVLAATARRVLRKSSVVVAGLYLFNPRVIFESVNGLETSLAMLALAVFLWVSVKVYEDGALRDWALFGLVGGLAFLTRTDLAIIMLVVIFGLAAACLRGPFRAQGYEGWRSRAKNLMLRMGLAGILALVVVVPWFAWSLWRVGTLVQSSAVAVPLLAQYRIAQGGNVWGELLWPVINFSLHALLIYPGVGWIVLIFGLVLLRFSRAIEPSKIVNHAVWKEPHESPAPIKGVYLLWAPVMGAVLLVIVHSVVRWYPRGWYFVPLALCVTLPAGVVFARLAARLKKKAKWGFVALMAILLLAQMVRMEGETTYPGQGQALEAARWLESNTPRGAIAGAFNSGILAYFSDREIVNLDGVVDWNAIRARQRNKLINYLVERDGTYLIDHQAYIWNSFQPFLGPDVDRLHQVKAFGSQDAQYGPLLVYQVDH
jgi:hypothetical protein